MRWEGLLEFASRQTGFSSSGRIVIVGPIHRKCPEVVVVAVDKIAGRCKQATESLGSDQSRERRRTRDTSHAIIRSDRCRSGCCGQRRNLAFGAAGNKGSWDRPPQAAA